MTQHVRSSENISKETGTLKRRVLNRRTCAIKQILSLLSIISISVTRNSAFPKITIYPEQGSTQKKVVPLRPQRFEGNGELSGRSRVVMTSLMATLGLICDLQADSADRRGPRSPNPMLNWLYSAKHDHHDTVPLTAQSRVYQ